MEKAEFCVLFSPWSLVSGFVYLSGFDIRTSLASQYEHSALLWARH